MRIYIYTQVSSGVFDEVEWDKWIYGPGMPPLKPQSVYIHSY